ncbi:MAG TPA: M23 family metallopeptidase [Dehalococcoidia bacterium]|nr:M23 family metallopeptidase [Dehalococcoidia bacterium]
MRSSPRRDKRPSNWLGRALTGLIIGLGLGAIALSVMPATPARVTTAQLAQANATDLTLPSVHAHASRASSLLRSGSGGDVASVGNPVVQPTPRPIVRQAAPLDALPAVGGARAISTGRPSGERASAVPAPFSVVVAVQDAASLQPLALAIVEGLLQNGVNATVAPLTDAGRPDVILALNGVPGSRNETWFCDPGPEQSIVLATELLEAIGPGEAATQPAEAPHSDFPCEDIHAGRARVPAVLIELANGGAAADPAVIVAAIRGYFGAHRGPVLAARAAPRLIWPALGPVTSHYDTNHPLGIDIGQWEGPIAAATDGVVSFAGGDPCCSYGTFVMIESGDGLATLYGHLSTLAVAEGQRVRQGDVLGLVGCTGTCFGTHLHFEVWRDGVRQNPMQYLD